MTSDADSLITFDPQDASIDDGWRDIRLIHESNSGWCAVYSAVYRGRRVAIKALKDAYRSSDIHQRLLRKEYEIVSELHHQNIVSVLWMQQVPGLGECLVLEYIDGITLADYMQEGRWLSRAKMREIIAQICAAVDYLHSRQIVHCDLKPSNIMITSAGDFVKLIDFGLSRGKGFKMLDFQGGTTGFMAPENRCRSTEASMAMDIYSIGKIMEWMDRNTVWRRVWRKCIATDQLKRPKSAPEIVHLLDREEQWKKSRRVRPALGAVVVIVGAGVWLWRTHYMPERSEENPFIELREEVDVDKEPPHDTVVEETREPLMEIQKPVVKESPQSPSASDNRPYQERLAEKFAQVAGSRFKDHLTLIDTMTTARSNELQQVGHWRWLAKQDMRKWLEGEFASDYARIEQEMTEIERQIEAYADFSHRRGIEWQHRVDAAERCPDLAGCTTITAYYEGVDMLVVRRLGEDGIWHETRTKVPIDRTDPDATMRIKREYLDRALND